jgi:diguanylate cyclase (GGDEF)-like protein/PAS domain S-box-containing protein
VPPPAYALTVPTESDRAPGRELVEPRSWRRQRRPLMTPAPAPAKLLQAIVDAAAAATAADSARLLLVSADQSSSLVAAVSGQADLAPGHLRPLDEGLGGWIVTNHRPLLVRSLRRQSCYPQRALAVALTVRGSDSMVGVPILDPITGSCVGVLGVLSRRTRAFAASSVRVLDLFAQVAAAALTATEREQALFDSRADRRIQEERADLLSSLVEMVDEGVALVDGQGIMRYCNPAFAKLFGRSAEELFGRTVNSVIRPEGGLNQAPGGGTAWSGDRLQLRLSGPAGSRVVALSRNQVVYGREGAAGWIVTARDATDRARWEERLRHQSEHDDLTGLPNRHQLHRRLTEVTANLEGRDPVVVFFIDMDGTKTVNDALGHGAGDELLRAVAARLSGRVRPSDLVARYGGDELVAVIEPLPAEDAPAFAERLLGALSQPLRLQGQLVRLSASIGFTVCRAGSDPASLLREADSAMYAAKRAGGNGWRAYQAELHDAALADLRLSSELRAALDQPRESGLYLAFQPIVHLGLGTCIGVEALLRWQHPRLGLVPPPQIVRIAHRFHELERLSDWILDQALADLAAWVPQGIDQVKLGVNFLPTELTDPGFAARVLEKLARHRISGSRLVVEITEHELGPELQPRVAATLKALARHGVLSALDDVGAGQSNLARLVDLPVKILKVDRAFVAGLPRDRRSSAVMRAFLSVGKDLEMDVVAEGVETRGQEIALRSYGCEMVQGFRYSHPLPSRELVEWVLRSKALALGAQDRPRSRVAAATTPLPSAP